MARLLGIDVGTSGAKVVLIDESGTVVKSATRSYRVASPRPGWAEQDPSDWVSAVVDCLSEIGERRPDAVGLTGQMHGLVALDAEGSPVRPAILWCDQRTARECQQIDDILGPSEVRRVTCNAPTTGFQAPKILWLRNNEGEAFSRITQFLLPKDYIRWFLSGTSHTDVTDASGTGLFDVERRRWWKDGIKGLGLDSEMFPPVHESCTVVAYTKKSDVLDEGVPIVAGAGDQAAGAVGTGAVSPGVCSISLGTSGVVFSAIESPYCDTNGSVNVFCHANGSWHAMGVMLSCGGAVKWARDTFFPTLAYSDLDALASDSPMGCDGLTFLPYLSGERCPHNDPSSRGALVGLTLAHDRSHVARAVMEGACFGLKGCFDLLSIEPQEILVTGGGARSAFWVQMLSNVFKSDCVQVLGDEGPAFGAAVLAGSTMGAIPELRVAASQIVKRGKRFSHDDADYGEALGRFRSLYPALNGP